MDKPVSNSIFCEEVTDNELLGIINDLKAYKSAGPDGFGPAIIKQFSTNLILPLVYKYNVSLFEGKVPEKAENI